MTDTEIIKALECCSNSNSDEDYCKDCPYNSIKYCASAISKDALNLINRQKAEIEEIVHKLECLLCHATGGKLSKHTYPLDIMYTFVNDEIQDYCEEARSEAVKEFVDLAIKTICEKVNAPSPSESYIVEKCIEVIDNLLKETVGDEK